MSYHHKSAFDKTPGTAYEAFDMSVRNPMIPNAAGYRPRAAGPSHLTGLGAHMYMAPLRQQRFNLQGLGADPVETLLGAAQGPLNSAVGLVFNAMWPMLQSKLDASLKPMQMFMGVSAVASIAGAVFAFLNWNKTP